MSPGVVLLGHVDCPGDRHRRQVLRVPKKHGRGGGRILYRELLDRLEQRGYRVAVGRIAVPNQPSVRLHEALGFEHVGTLRSIGWKNGSWHDVTMMQKVLGDVSVSPQTIGD